MIIGFLKSGNKIHIKKSHEGSFTEHCGGKVTDACIQSAKQSSNPKLRKKAIFAENARKWKHQYGGSINGAPSKRQTNNRGQTIPDKKQEEIVKMNQRRYPGITERQALGLDSVKLDHHYYRINRDGKLIPSRRYQLGGSVIYLQPGGVLTEAQQAQIDKLLEQGNVLEAKNLARIFKQRAATAQASTQQNQDMTDIFNIEQDMKKADSGGGFLDTLSKGLSTAVKVGSAVMAKKNASDSTAASTSASTGDTNGAAASAGTPETTATTTTTPEGTKVENGQTTDTTPKDGDKKVDNGSPASTVPEIGQEAPKTDSPASTQKSIQIQPTKKKFNFMNILGESLAQVTGNTGWSNLGNMNFFGGESKKHKRETLYNDNTSTIDNWGLADFQKKKILNDINNGGSYTDTSGVTWIKDESGKIVKKKSGGKVFGIPYSDPADDAGKVNPRTKKLIKRKGIKYNIGGHK